MVKIKVNKVVTEIYEISDEQYESIFEPDSNGEINWIDDKWSDDEIAGIFEDQGKLISKNWEHPEDPIEWL
jgi:hypothetical protein